MYVLTRLVLWGAVAWGAEGGVLDGHWPVIVKLAASMVVFAAVVAVYWRYLTTAFVIGQDAVEIRNPFRRWTVPWSGIDEVFVDRFGTVSLLKGNMLSHRTLAVRLHDGRVRDVAATALLTPRYRQQVGGLVTTEAEAHGVVCRAELRRARWQRAGR